MNRCIRWKKTTPPVLRRYTGTDLCHKSMAKTCFWLGGAMNFILFKYHEATIRKYHHDSIEVQQIPTKIAANIHKVNGHIPLHSPLWQVPPINEFNGHWHSDHILHAFGGRTLTLCELPQLLHFVAGHRQGFLWSEFEVSVEFVYPEIL